jgi:hypothetical protein
MKLTEAKLKQMILEAIKNKNFQDFGISTPDEKLRAELGDEMFDKIQALDPDQSEVLKQSFDPDYPESIKQETIEDILKPYGFTESAPTSGDKSSYIFRVFRRGKGPYYEFYLFYQTVPTFVASKYRGQHDSRRYPNSIRYGFELKKDYQDILLKKEGSIQVPEMFNHDFLDVEEKQNLESFLIKKEKDAIIKALSELT